MSAIRTVGVVGSGVIGASWVVLFLARGLRVLVSDPEPGAADALKKFIDAAWPTLEQIGLASGASSSNYEFVGASLGERFKEVDFVQENAPENQELKEKLLAEIDASSRSDVVIASSSSGLPSSKFIGGCQKNAGRILIGHPFNPPHLMPLVEIVPHPGTCEESVTRAMEFYKSLGKHPVRIWQEIPGHVANRLQVAVLNEAYSLVSRGIISADDLDLCVTTSIGPRWALTGSFVANAMGGGGGAEGFKQSMQRLGPARQSWLDDMQKHRFTWDEQSIDKLTASVRDEFGAHNMEKVVSARDEVLMKLLRLKLETGVLG